MWLLGVMLVAAVLAGTLMLPRGATFVDRLTLHNRTNDQLQVALRSAESDDRIPIATLEPHDTTRVDEVGDQGSTWVFVVSRHGRELVRFVIPRDALASASWRLEIPPR
jgi:hypothetical protein